MGRNERQNMENGIHALWRHVDPLGFEEDATFEEVDAIHDLFTGLKQTPPPTVSRVLRERIREREQDLRDSNKYGNQ
jgi:hypothetical protein